MQLSTLEYQYNQLLHHTKLTTGCPLIDSNLQGGFIRDTLVEFYGQSGTAKTSLACQIAFNSLLENVSDKAIFISTFKKLDRNRKQQILEGVVGKDEIQQQQLDNRLFTPFLQNYEQFNNFIYGSNQNSLHDLLKKHKVNIIVVDTICAIYDEFIDYVNKNSTQIQNQKKKFLFELAKRFKDIACQYNLVVLNVNNVVTDIENNKLKPQMGSYWGSLIHERFEFIKYQNTMFKQSSRSIEIHQSIRLDNKSFKIVANNKGVFGL